MSNAQPYSSSRLIAALLPWPDPSLTFPQSQPNMERVTVADAGSPAMRTRHVDDSDWPRPPLWGAAWTAG